MKVRLKEKLLVITAESSEEAAEIASLSTRADGHVFSFQPQAGDSVRFADLGPREVVCREPINVTSRHHDPTIRLISNFAETPFELDGKTYTSVEAFWQGLKFPGEIRRREIAMLHGQAAKDAGSAAELTLTLEYAGETIRVGTCEHWKLMEKANRAKFTQHAAARAALLGTGDRPLVHKVRRDSRTIPGVIMGEIWMRVRRRFAKRESD